MGILRPRTLGLVLLIAGLVLGLALVIAQDQETLRVHVPLDVTDPRFPPYLARLLGRPLTSGDRYVVLKNGARAFPAMLSAIAGAKRGISFESYIYSHGAIATAFTRELTAAAARGVRVQIVRDAITSHVAESRRGPENQRAKISSGLGAPSR